MQIEGGPTIAPESPLPSGEGVGGGSASSNVAGEAESPTPNPASASLALSGGQGYADAPEGEGLVSIPYAFARKFGVALNTGDSTHFSIAMREGSDPKVLLELRRHLAR